MRSANRLPRAVVQQMNRAIFNVYGDGVLRYLDPTIGTLDNGKRQIVVRTEPGCVALELWVDGQIAEVFPLFPHTQETCAQAFFAYFSTYETLCRQEQLKHRAA